MDPPGKFPGDAVEHFVIKGRTAFRHHRWFGFGKRFDNRNRRLRVDQHRDVHIGVDGVDQYRYVVGFGAALAPPLHQRIGAGENGF